MQEITYLSGIVVPVAQNSVATPNLGVLITPLMGNAPESVTVQNPEWGTLHAHDNGVWSEFKSGVPFRLDRFLAHLDRWQPWQEQALFATAPDVVGDWKATLERSLPVLPQIRERGYKAALVAQDGLLARDVPWDDLDVIFLGGGKHKSMVRKGNLQGEWKLSQGARRLTTAARERGKQVHMGRVNSLLRIQAAQAMGCNSADGTFLKFGTKETMPESIRQMLGWLTTSNAGCSHSQTSCYVCLQKMARWAEQYGMALPDSAFARRAGREAPRPCRQCGNERDAHSGPGLKCPAIALPIAA